MAEEQPANTNTALKIAEIDHVVRRMGTDMSGLRQEVRDFGQKLDKVVELQIQQQHTGQAIERAFNAISENKRISETGMAKLAGEAEQRQERWELWRTNFEESRSKIVSDMSATINGWKGGVRVLYVLSAMVWALFGAIANYYVTNQAAERATFEAELQRIDTEAAQRSVVNSERLRTIELYLAKNPTFEAGH